MNKKLNVISNWYPGKCPQCAEPFQIQVYKDRQSFADCTKCREVFILEGYPRLLGGTGFFFGLCVFWIICKGVIHLGFQEIFEQLNDQRSATFGVAGVVLMVAIAATTSQLFSARFSNWRLLEKSKIPDIDFGKIRAHLKDPDTRGQSICVTYFGVSFFIAAMTSVAISIFTGNPIDGYMRILGVLFPLLGLGFAWITIYRLDNEKNSHT